MIVRSEAFTSVPQLHTGVLSEWDGDFALVKRKDGCELRIVWVTPLGRISSQKDR